MSHSFFFLFATQVSVRADKGTPERKHIFHRTFLNPFYYVHTYSGIILTCHQITHEIMKVLI